MCTPVLEEQGPQNYTNTILSTGPLAEQLKQAAGSNAAASAVAASVHCVHCGSDDCHRHHGERPADPTVSLVIPAKNEAHNLPWVLLRIPDIVTEVIVVDSESNDGTIDVVKLMRPDAKIITQPAYGKGVALATGMLASTCDVCVMIDADGSMDPAEIPMFVGALVAGADVVKGSRTMPGGGSDDITRIRHLGNWGLGVVANLLYRQSWSELCYGYAAFWTDTFERLGIAGLADPDLPNADDGITRSLIGASQLGSKKPMPYGHGFEIEAVLFCRAAHAGMRVAEVFSWEYERRHGHSNLTAWRDGLRVSSAILRERMPTTAFNRKRGFLRHNRKVAS